jgi:hypothetical protein
MLPVGKSKLDDKITCCTCGIETLHLDGVKTNLYFTLLSTNNVYLTTPFTRIKQGRFYRLSHKSTSSILPLANSHNGKSLKENLLKDGALASLGKSLMMAFILRCASFRKVNFCFVFSVMETVDKLSYERESIF